MSASEFRYLWDGTEEGWALVKLDGGSVAYAIANRNTKRALIIEDDAAFAGAVANMLSHGCPVITPKELTGK